MKAYAVVGPTNRQPRRFRSLAKAVDSAVSASSASAARSNRPVRGSGAKLQT